MSSTTTQSAVSVYKGPKGPLCHRCPLCAAVGPQLLRCAGCRAFRYCGREHQTAHWLQHKSACSKIKKARTKLAQEDHKVRHATPDFMTPANAFETDAGHFWGLINTRDYMRARFALARALLFMGTLDSVQETLDHLLDMLRLCRGDNMGVRSLVPAIMLRLDLDQECYDFVKWWATCDPDGTYDWGDVDLPYLDLRGADVFEESSAWVGKYSELNHVVALLILKLKLLVDIRSLKITRKVLGQRLPLELRDQIEQDVIRSPLAAKLLKKSPESLNEVEIELMDEVCVLGGTVHESNNNFTFNLFEPDEALSTQPDMYSRGSWEEMALAMQYSYAAWWETEGVLDLLDDARACAAQDTSCEIEDLMKSEKARQGRTAEELLADMSINRIWGYMDYAVENGSYLGPWSERPSERYIREDRESLERAEAAERAEMEALSDSDAWTDDED